MSNLIDDLRLTIGGLIHLALGVPMTPEQDKAKDSVLRLIDAYDALAPDWTQAPEWAQWYAIHAINEAKWYQNQPYPGDEGYWKADDGFRRSVLDVDLPVGLDWRICLWQRPQAA